MTLSELAETEGITRPSMTALAAYLYEHQLIRKEPDPSDGRSVRLYITEAGRRVVDRSRTRRNAYLAKQLRALNADEVRILDAAATILVRLVEEGR